MQKVVVDTNFLLAQFEYRIDLVSEFRRLASGPLILVVASGTLDEIEVLSGRAGRAASAARFVRANFGLLQKAFQVEIAASSGPVDEWIIKYAQKNSVSVATNDLPLRARLRALGVPVIAMKGKSKLDFI